MTVQCSLYTRIPALSLKNATRAGHRLEPEGNVFAGEGARATLAAGEIQVAALHVSPRQLDAQPVPDLGAVGSLGQQSVHVKL